MLKLQKVRKVLTEVAFNPKTPGPMSALISINDPKYFAQHAKVLIDEHLEHRRVNDTTHKYGRDSLLTAIRLLILAYILSYDSE